MRFVNIPLLCSVGRTLLNSNLPKITSFRPSSFLHQISSFKESLRAAKNVVIISGDDVSSESGLSITGDKGLWRNYQVSSLANANAFLTFPSLVWEFYHYRRESAAKAQPNEAHKAIAQFEDKYGTDKSITVLTQCVDGLHRRAGTKNLIELHGSLFKTRCLKCQDVVPNDDNPICEALANKGAPDVEEVNSNIPEKFLPHCSKSSCSGLLRPHIVWVGETLENSVIKQAEQAMAACDILLLVGSATLMFPVAIYASEAMDRGAIVAEFNNNPSETAYFHYFFDGPCSQTLPKALKLES